MLKEIGKLTKDDQLGWLISEFVEIPLFQKKCRFIFEQYEERDEEEYLKAINNLLSLEQEVFKSASKDLYSYYEDTILLCELEPGEYDIIEDNNSVWSHVEFGDDIMVCRRSDHDCLIYLSIESECSWEIEHGLQVVFRNGNTICKLGPFDSHLTNSDAYADPSLEDVVYKSMR